MSIASDFSAVASSPPEEDSVESNTPMANNAPPPNRRVTNAVPRTISMMFGPFFSDFFFHRPYLPPEFSLQVFVLHSLH